MMAEVSQKITSPCRARPGRFAKTCRRDPPDLSAKLIENLATLPAEEMYHAADGALVVAPHFRRLHTALGADRLHLASGDRYEVLVRGKGANSRVVRADVPQPSYTQEQIESTVGRQIAELPAEGRPSGPAATRSIVVDEGGNVWVETFPTDETIPGEWSVFDPEGGFVAVAVTPPGFRPFVIGPDYVLGVWRGEAGVEEVRSYRRGPVF